MVRRHVVRAEAGENHELRRRAAAGQRRDGFERRLVGPVNVFKNQQQRLLRGEFFERRAKVARGAGVRGMARMAEIGKRDPHAIAVYVAAILIEAGAWREMDKIIVVSCGRARQIERAMQRPGAMESSVLARLESQMPLEKKLAFADYVIDTSGTKEDTLRQTAIVYEDLRRQA